LLPSSSKTEPLPASYNVACGKEFRNQEEEAEEKKKTKKMRGGYLRA
jgi:hypothetical protein